VSSFLIFCAVLYRFLAMGRSPIQESYQNVGKTSQSQKLILRRNWPDSLNSGTHKNYVTRLTCISYFLFLLPNYIHPASSFSSSYSLALQPGVGFSLLHNTPPFGGSSEGFVIIILFWCGVVSPTPNPQPRGSGLHIYISWRLGVPVIVPGTEYPF
jgi:hypothetical protein